MKREISTHAALSTDSGESRPKGLTIRLQETILQEMLCNG